MTNFLEQAKQYQGAPTRIAYHTDAAGEYHVIIEMCYKKRSYWLDWIGGEYAEEPDEFEEEPFNNLNWRAVK